jgi:predicted AAA+ superfamily ATPase
LDETVEHCDWMQVLTVSFCELVEKSFNMTDLLKIMEKFMEISNERSYTILDRTKNYRPSGSLELEGICSSVDTIRGGDYMYSFI